MLYLITGPAGVGKSTISNLLAASKSKSALVEGDDFYHLVKGGYVSPWKQGNHLAVYWENVTAVIDNFLRRGFDVVFNAVFFKEDLERLAARFGGAEIKFVLLTARPDVIVARDQARPPDCQMGKRVLILLREFEAERFGDRHILDTSGQSAEETASEIERGERFRL